MAAACPTDILVEIDGTEEYEILEPLATTDGNASQSEVEQNNQLCGYLAKVNQGGIMKGSKTRWFVFNKNKCVLHYHRSPKDTSGSPIGSIPISNAAFTCTAEGLLVNSFQITQGSHTHILQAYDQKTMLWWLQELQAERRLYNMRRKRSSTRKAASTAPTDNNQAVSDVKDAASPSGLLQGVLQEEESSKEDESYGDSLSIIPVLPRVENPPETVGIKSAHLNVLKLGSGSALSEIGNKVTQLGASGITKLRPKPPRPAPPSPASIFYAKQNNTEMDESLTLGPALQVKGSEPKQKSALSRTTQRFSHLLDSIQSAVKTGGKSSSTQLDEITETLALLQEEMELMKTSLDSKEETIQLLKRELSKYSTLNSSSPAITSFENDCPSSTHQLRSEITTLKLTTEHLKQELDETKLLFKQQAEKTKLFQEMLQVKDGIVVQLTNEIHDLETTGKLQVKTSATDEARSRSVSSKSIPETPMLKEKQSEEILASRKLLDEVEGYRLQNKFLNNEILELTHLRKVDQEKIDSLYEKNLHQEALRCQLQSKYFILLSEMDKARSQTVVVYSDTEDPLLHQEGVPSKPSVVQQLIQQAIQEGGRREQEIGAIFRSSKHDKYGFTQIVDDSDESTFLSAASQLQQTASNIFNSIEEHDATVAAKWQRYSSEKDYQRNAEFKALVRMGIPHELRHKVWKYLVHVRTHEIRQQLNSDGLYYKRLTETAVAPLHSKQIDLDLLRTLPNNRFFSKLDSVGIQRLKHVLGAYSLHNPGIGYCQGLNRIVAVSLLYLSEEDAFWCLVAIVECIMPQEYYTSTLTASQADQRVFRDLLAEKMPRIHRHLELMGIDVSLITFNWFLCIFCDGVPPQTMFAIWDVFLNESSKVLFRYALAFFKHIEDDILELNDYMTLFNLLRKMVYRMYDARTLTQIAFQGMNPFPMRKVDRFRVFHIEKVHGELHQLDLLRSEFASRHAKASTNSDMYSDDEGDND